MTAQALRKPPIEETDLTGESTHGKADPAQSAIDIAANQETALINGIHDAVTGPASRLRDQIDGVIRSIGKQRDTRIESVERWRQDANNALAALSIMSEGCEKLIENMGSDLPETVTQFAPRRRVGQQQG